MIRVPENDLWDYQEITESSGRRHRPAIVMVPEGAPSTACSGALGQAVDGRPPPDMTASGDSAALAAIISRRAL
jgi:hypothetical protein